MLLPNNLLPRFSVVAMSGLVPPVPPGANLSSRSLGLLSVAVGNGGASSAAVEEA